MSKNNDSNAAKVAIVFDDLTEFFVMRDAIDTMIKQKIYIDIIVPFDSGYNGLAEHTYNKLKELGYDPKKDVDKDHEYKVLLTPYPDLRVVYRTKYVYHLKYPYSAVSSKPNPTFLPEWNVPYDGIFSFNTYEPELLKVPYGVNYHVVPYWKYRGFQKINSSSKKPRLLILPTFGPDVSCIHLFTKKLVQDLKKEYFIISKAHHATHFNRDKDDSLALLRTLSDEFYDSDVPISQLLQNADLVLSDNSGAIFEAIRVDVPVALFAKKLDSRRLGIIAPIQYDLVSQDILPYADQPEKVLPMLRTISKYKKKQSALKRRLFVMDESANPVSGFIDIIKKYLSSDPEQDYHKAIHKLLVESMDRSRVAIEDLTKQLSEKELRVSELENIVRERDKVIQDIYASTSWKLTTPLRGIGKIIKKQ